MSVDRATYATVAALKPAAAKVLIAMLFCPSLHGVVEIAENTGMNRGTVSSAMVNLEKLGFVCNNGRYEAWILTARARQMILGEGENIALAGPDDGDVVEVEGDILSLDPDAAAAEPDPESDLGAPEAREGEILALASSSSSSLTTSSPSSQVVKTTTTKPALDVNVLDPPDRERIDQAIDWLREAAIPRRQALSAIAIALAAGWNAAQVSDCVGGWLDYADTPAGATIRSPGRVALARLQACEPAPVIDQDPAMTTRDYIRQAMEARGL